MCDKMQKFTNENRFLEIPLETSDRTEKEREERKHASRSLPANQLLRKETKLQREKKEHLLEVNKKIQSRT